MIFIILLLSINIVNINSFFLETSNLRITTSGSCSISNFENLSYLGYNILSSTSIDIWRLRINSNNYYPSSGSINCVEVEGKVGERDCIIFEYVNVPNNVRVNVTICTNDEDYELRIGVGNEVNVVIDEVEFPIMSLKRFYGEEERIYVSEGEGAVIRSEGLNNLNAKSKYPGQYSMQLIAYYNEYGGLGIEWHDSEGHQKEIGFSTSGGTVTLGSLLRLPDEQGYDIPNYPVVLYYMKGPDYLFATKHYHEWASLQPWYVKAKNERISPQWINNNLMMIESNLQKEFLGIRRIPLPDVGDIYESWRNELVGDHCMTKGECGDKVNFHMVGVVRSFEYEGPYVSPHYFPLTTGVPRNGDERGLEEYVKSIRKYDHHSFWMVSGLIWIRQRDIYATGSSYWVPGYDGNHMGVNGWDNYGGDEVCAEKKSGGCTFTNYASWSGERTEMCPAHSYGDITKNFGLNVLKNVSERISKIGGTQFNIDQINGGRSDPCWSNSHGHPKGYGDYLIKGVAKVFEEARKIGIENNENFSMTIEDPQEHLLPYLDMVGCRPNNINGWPGPNIPANLKKDGYIESFVKLVPGFTAVYGDLVRCQAWDMNQNAKAATSEFNWLETTNVELATWELARTFITGSIPCIQIPAWQLVRMYAPEPNGWSTSDGEYAPSAEITYDAIKMTPERMYDMHFYFLRTIARSRLVLHDYFVHPDFLYANISNVDWFQFNTYTWNGTYNVPTPYNTPAILFQAFKKRSNGDVAFVAVNFDPFSEHEVDKFTHFDLNQVSEMECFKRISNGCDVKSVVYQDIPDKITINALEILIFETCSAELCSSDFENNYCDYESDDNKKWIIYAVTIPSAVIVLLLVTIVLCCLVSYCLKSYKKKKKDVSNDAEVNMSENFVEKK